MLASHVAAEGIVPIQVLVVVLAVAAVIFWRVALKIIVILAVILLASGAVAFIEGLLRGIK